MGEVATHTATGEQRLDRGVEGAAAAELVADPLEHPVPDGTAAPGPVGQPAELDRGEGFERVGRAVSALPERDQLLVGAPLDGRRLQPGVPHALGVGPLQPLHGGPRPHLVGPG